jgi:LmbE family N-acetylglucosaminyl deacetylase
MLIAFTSQIITFDQGGISGHLNHRAVSKALKYVVSAPNKYP